MEVDTMPTAIRTLPQQKGIAASHGIFPAFRLISWTLPVQPIRLMPAHHSGV